ncbi:hypothetical protein DBV15_01102 [Temnothorax longispinosus]|uniref:Uncharacterized protein n=1 Tax=Temnothorax longispinosus TaxID=300112 RepID=A0A4S2JCK8_9HYME|nr:hypothetical protein DBV15_01102 [Temnothorax longispinosus]
MRPAREERRIHEGDQDMERDLSRRKGACNIASRAFIILQLRYRIIFSIRVGINERIKMHIPASSFACLRIGSGELERERERERKSRRERELGRAEARSRIEEERGRKNGRRKDGRSACVQAYRYRPRAVRHVGATKVFYACQMKVLVSDLTLNSLDDPRDRVKLESGLEATYQRSCASVAFSVLFRPSAVRRPNH